MITVTDRVEQKLQREQERYMVIQITEPTGGIWGKFQNLRYFESLLGMNNWHAQEQHDRVRKVLNSPRGDSWDRSK